MRIYNAKVYRPSGDFVEGEFMVEGERFSTTAPEGEQVDVGGCYAIPGLMDIHLHGCVGHDFSISGIEGLEAMARYQAQNGVTGICPATVTLDEATLAAACGRMAGLSMEGGAQVAGIHLEGPFISPHKLGAQNPDFVQPPDVAMFRRLQEAAGGLVKLLAIAPEMEGALEAIEEISREATCSLAHTTADYDTATEAFRRGARQVTHLYNAMPPLTHREPGVIGAALDFPQCMVELICDGVHIHPSVVRATFKMFGDRRVILISDSMMATGLEDGDYQLGGLPVQVRGNEARLANGGSIAGSVTNLMDCLRTAVNKMGIPLHSAVRCATESPARAIGVFDKWGSIEPGKYANFVLLEEDLSIRQVYVKGRAI